MEGGIHKAEKTEFTECWRTSLKTPYIMRLALSAGIGGLLFGYDTGVISGALLYIRDDFKSVDKKTWLQETIVSMAVAGAIFGAALGGWMNDRFGRRKSILVADFLFFVGAIVMAFAPQPWVIIIGRIFVGLGVGMASMTSPLYISEASPARIRGALVSTNGFLITGGQFLAYLINLAFTNESNTLYMLFSYVLVFLVAVFMLVFSWAKVNGTWRWMLGVAGVPAVIQFFLMLTLPESPRWLYRQNKIDEARAILMKIYSEEEVEEEMNALEISIQVEKAEEAFIGEGMFAKLKNVFSNKIVRRGLYAGITVQVAQQFVGINTVMYYSPTIVQLAGFASNKTALALSLITSGLNAFGSIISMVTVDRYGRRRLMIVSIVGIIVCLVALSVMFFEASSHAPKVGFSESAHFGANSTCLSYQNAGDGADWNCMKCLKASSDCAFCASPNKYLPGACVSTIDSVKSMCKKESRTWYTKDCPSKIGILTVLLLGLYIIVYSPGMGTVPWIVNSEIYPLRYRGIGGGIAAVCNWCSNLVVSESFLSLTEALGASGTFLLFAGFSFLGLIGIYLLVPETKGLPFEEVEKLLEKGYKPSLFSRRKNKDVDSVELKK